MNAFGKLSCLVEDGRQPAYLPVVPRAPLVVSIRRRDQGRSRSHAVLCGTQRIDAVVGSIKAPNAVWTRHRVLIWSLACSKTRRHCLDACRAASLARSAICMPSCTGTFWRSCIGTSSSASRSWCCDPRPSISRKPLSVLHNCGGTVARSCRRWAATRLRQCATCKKKMGDPNSRRWRRR